MFKWFADLVTYRPLNLPRGAHLSESVNFFLYDIPKIYFLLITVVFIVAIIRSFLPPEKTRKILSHEKEFFGNILAAVHYILSNPAMHKTAANILGSYLGSVKGFVQKIEHMDTEYEGTPWIAGNIWQQWEIYEEVVIFPERKIAQRLLRRIQNIGDQETTKTAQSLLDNAPPFIVKYEFTKGPY